ncbi:replication protein A, subunit RPA32 [Lichtheimia hyalospora FSU 10163]|nr:replication protein A, subunit RPA32 [Lichtheimia hyalospora FSU 10163]
MEGGFFNNDNAGGFSEGSSFSGSKRTLNEHTIRPLTVKQFQDIQIVSDNVFRLDNMDINSVTVVGVVRDISPSTTNLQYTIEDGTAMMEVRHWHEGSNTDGSEIPSDISKGSYVRVNGRVNQFNNRINCIAFAIRPITDFNEVTFHFLEAILSHVKLTKPSGGDHMQIDSGNGAPKSLSDRVIEVVKRYHHEEAGVHMDQIAKELQDVADKQRIKEVVDELVNEGHCYSTIDEEYIKSTEA